MVAARSANKPDGAEQVVMVWDTPVRLVHWGLAVLLPALWWTSENHEMWWHMLLGKILLGLLVFRLVWGLFGSSTARFASFLPSPRAVWNYLRAGRTGGRWQGLGHNPLGALSVVAMLSLLLLQVGLGLVAGDPDDGATGPLNHHVAYATATAATRWHATVFYAIAAMVALHLAAIAYYALARRDNLVVPMLTGHKRMPNLAPRPELASRTRAGLCAIFAAACAWWLGSGAPTVIP